MQPEETWREYRPLLAQLGNRPTGALQALPRQEDAVARQPRGTIIRFTLPLDGHA